MRKLPTLAEWIGLVIGVSAYLSAMLVSDPWGLLLGMAGACTFLFGFLRMECS